MTNDLAYFQPKAMDVSRAMYVHMDRKKNNLILDHYINTNKNIIKRSNDRVAYR